jgi:hypothetical protein
MSERVKFVVTLVPTPGTNGVHALRWALKTLLRRYGLRAMDVREEQDTPVTNVADAFVKIHHDVRTRLRERS